MNYKYVPIYRLHLVFLICLLQSHISRASFFSYIEEQSTSYDISKLQTEQKALYASMPKQKKETKVFVSGHRVARVSDNIVNIRDYKNDKMLNINHAKKTWSESSMIEVAKAALKSIETQNAGAKSQTIRRFKEMKKEKVIDGNKCRFFQVYSLTKTRVGGKTVENISNIASCRWLETPQAWRSHANYLEKFAENNKKIIQVSLQGDVESPLRSSFSIYSKMWTEVKGLGEGGSAPTAVMEIRARNISTQPFDSKIFNVPTGYKKVK